MAGRDSWYAFHCRTLRCLSPGRKTSEIDSLADFLFSTYTCRTYRNDGRAFLQSFVSALDIIDGYSCHA